MNRKGSSVVQEGARVLRLEAEALLALAGSIDASFEEAVDVVHSAAGRVVVTGMGKSGHIAAKIAATFASTGSPAFYVHPGEASHGDLGMVQRGDVVLALSHTGGTSELGDLLAFCQEHGNPVIAITARADSLLGNAADIVLLTGVTSEACPIGLAPMTSTTASLALGDALAAALMQRRGFVARDFAGFHPGGKLGSRLMTAAKLMHRDDAMPAVSESAFMPEALLVMSEKRLGHVLITDAAGKLRGIISDGDLRRHMSPGLLEAPVTQIMTPAPVTVGPDTMASAALALMEARSAGSITALPVVDEENRVLGLLHIHDCLSHG